MRIEVCERLIIIIVVKRKMIIILHTFNLWGRLVYCFGVLELFAAFNFGHSFSVCVSHLVRCCSLRVKFDLNMQMVFASSCYATNGRHKMSIQSTSSANLQYF